MYTFFDTQEDLETILWPYPPLGPERGSTIMWSHTFAAPRDLEGAKLDATMRLIKYLSDHSDYWTANAGMPTARISLRDEDLKAEVWTLATFDEQFRAEGVMEFSSDQFSEIMDAVEAEWSAALTQQKTVEEALNDAAQRIERVLD
jgi:ABC-type glycerol-3-phosphate transport system substrate-binding protein